jgi:hypothetical protein
MVARSITTSRRCSVITTTFRSPAGSPLLVC